MIPLHLLILGAFWANPTQAAPAKSKADCDDGTWELTVKNYLHFETDKNFQTWWAGGQNEGGPVYQAQPKGGDGSLAISLAKKFFPTGSESQFGCTLEAGKCDVPDGCTNYGIHDDKTDQVGDPIHWSWFVTHSISTLYSFGQEFHTAFLRAGTQVNFDLLDLTDTFTKKGQDQEILTKDLLIGFSFLTTVAFSFVPIAGTIVGAATSAAVVGALGGAAGGVLSTANGYFSNALSSGESLDAKAKEFGSFMSKVWQIVGANIDYLIKDMMSGKEMDKDGKQPLLLSVLQGGGWVDSSVLNKDSLDVTSLQELIYKDLIQRGINYIWSQSKIWVSFADLKDDDKLTKCMADKNGWQDSKHCADGGVYYLYRFNEDGNLAGELSYPWGAEKMAGEPYGLDPFWVTRSSALSYRAQNDGEGGFAYDPHQPPSNLHSLLETVSKGKPLSTLGGLAGVWNISVCDMGTHSDWNTDFTQDDPQTPFKKMAFPCCCGPKCSQTAAFIASAQMNNFDTVVYSCKKQLQSCDAWPEGVTEINYGDSGSIKKGEPSGDKNCVVPDD